MFLKLLKYDLSYSKNIFLLMIAITLTIGIGVFVIRFFDSEFNIFAIDGIIVRDLGTLLVDYGILIMGGAVIIQIVQLYYKSFFSKTGYFTLTLPFKRSSLLISKILVSIFWFNLLTLVMIVFAWLLGYAPESMWSDALGSWFGFVGRVLLPAANGNFSVLFLCSLIFFCITLGNSVILGKKVNIIVSLVFTGILFAALMYIGDVISRFLFETDWGYTVVGLRRHYYDGAYHLTGWTFFSWIMHVLVGATATVFFIITHYLLKRKVSLK